MKKLLSVLSIFLVLCLCFASCDEGGTTACNHQWEEATCKTPKTCSKCNKTEGEVSLSHSYVEDTCEHCGLIRLTLQNYKDYIDCNATVRAGDSIDYSIYGYVYTSAECNFEATGNSHYKYNDVTIVVKFSHYDKAGYQQYLKNQLAIMTGNSITAEAEAYREMTCTVKLNLAGNGKRTCELSTPWSSEASTYKSINAIFDRTAYEVISISGTVQEY